jgi:type I restriction enzyme M protein
MNPKTGRCAILFPHGVLFREDEQSIRKKIIADDIIECVLGLGPNLFYNSTMEACVITCRMQKTSEQKGKILFINAVKEVTIEKPQSFIEEHHRMKILDAYRNFKDIDFFSRVVSIDEICENQSRLKISDYVNSDHHSREGEPLEELIDDWQKSNSEKMDAMGALLAVTREAGLHD